MVIMMTQGAVPVNDESGTATFAEIPGVDGYTSVTIRRRPYLMHQLVMRAHVGLTPPGHNIDHIDRDRSNNTLGNLRFATPSAQNQNRGVVTRKLDHSVVRIDEQGAEALYSSVSVAAEALQSTRKMPTVVTRIYAAVRSGCLYQGFLRKRKHNNGQWTPIPTSVINGHRGYFASPDGQIKMPDGRSTLGSSHSSGYRFVNIMGMKTRVHILIAGTFLEPLVGRGVVNHKNGDKTDNRVSNLEYVNHRENAAHAHATGLIARAP
jgi:HNH endonuclease